jgi:hypothetical protein
MADSVVFSEPVAKKQLWPLGPNQHHKVYLAIPERLLTLSPCSIMQGSAVDWRRVGASHGRMNYKDTEPYMSAFLLN